MAKIEVLPALADEATDGALVAPGVLLGHVERQNPGEAAARRRQRWTVT